jgi:hypothetical protein
MLKAKSVRTLVPSKVGFTSAVESVASELDEQAVKPIVPVRAIALIKAKYLIFFILRKILFVITKLFI